MPRKPKYQHKKIAGLNDHQREILFFGSRLIADSKLPPFDSESQRRTAWKHNRDQLMGEWLKEPMWAGSRPWGWFKYDLDEPAPFPMSGIAEALFLLNGEHLYKHEIESVLKFLSLHNVEPNRIKASLRWRYQHHFNANKQGYSCPLYQFYPYNGKNASRGG